MAAVVARPTPHHRGADTTRQAVLIWLLGVTVACGAGIATAHGLYEVALARTSWDRVVVPADHRRSRAGRLCGDRSTDRIGCQLRVDGRRDLSWPVRAGASHVARRR